MSKIKKHLTRQLHHNRYFIWAIASIVIVGAALASYIWISNYDFERQLIFSDIISEKVYVNPVQKYSARYPRGWILEKDNSGNTVFENPAAIGESITVSIAPLEFESMIRGYLNISSEIDYQKNNLSIALIRAGTMKDNSQISIGIIKSSSRLYYINGNSGFFAAFLNNFRAL